MAKLWKKILKINNVLLDLIAGLVIFGVVGSLVGCLTVEDKPGFVLGMLVGTLASMGLAVHMYTTLDRGLDMDEKSAQSYVLSRSMLRLFLMLVVAYAGFVIEALNPAGVILGLFGLKISAIMQPWVSQYITNKIFREGE